MKYWIMRMPEPIPPGLTLFRAMIRATLSASLANVPSGGKVETVFTFETHFFFRGMIPSAG